MAYGEVLSRVTVLQLRARRAHRARRAGLRSSTRTTAADTR
jgi:hypothetical protein